ncbi:50S ribosomal protein L7/L12, partial [Geodia barretti]
EQTEFDASAQRLRFQEDSGYQRVRAITGLGLKEAKEKVESAPSRHSRRRCKEEAEKTKEQLEALGATVEII